MWVAFVHLRGSKELTKPKALAGYKREENLTKISDAFIQLREGRDHHSKHSFHLLYRTYHYSVHFLI